MAICKISKRIWLTEKVLKNKNISPSKRVRYNGKLAFLKGINPQAVFLKGAKTHNEGGYK